MKIINKKFYNEIHYYHGRKGFYAEMHYFTLPFDLKEEGYCGCEDHADYFYLSELRYFNHKSLFLLFNGVKLCED